MAECPNCGAMVDQVDQSCRYCSCSLTTEPDSAPVVNDRFREEPPNAPPPPPMGDPSYGRQEQDSRQPPPPPYPQGYQQGPYQQPPYQQPPYQQPPYQQPPYQQPPYQGQAAYNPLPQYRDISKIAAGVLGIVLGGIGVHKFYTGKIGLGIVYILFCWTGIPSIIGLIEGIIYLTMDDIAFREKYARRY